MMNVRRPTLALAPVLVAGALVGGLSACGGGSDDPVPETTTPDVSAYQPQFQPFARCVGEQGVDPPPPTQWMAPGGVTAELLAAARACRKHLPEHGQRLLDQYVPR
jgi:hypothetical protein